MYFWGAVVHSVLRPQVSLVDVDDRKGIVSATNLALFQANIGAGQAKPAVLAVLRRFQVTGMQCIKTAQWLGICVNTTFLVKGNDKAMEETNLYFADKEVFKVFSWHALAGDLSTALDLPNSVVLTKTAALKYFGTEDILGQLITLNNQFLPEPFEAKVTAVIEDIPPEAAGQPIAEGIAVSVDPGEGRQKRRVDVHNTGVVSI